MSKTIEELKRDYAELVIRAGVNIQKGQRLAITCPVECADFARMCAAEAYRAGCSEVIMRWEDDQLTRLKYLHADDSVFDRMNSWEADLAEILSAEGAAWLAVHADDPDNLKGVDPDRIRRAQISRGKALENFRAREMKSEFPWCVCSVPTAAWARAVFPEMEESKAIARLWDEILAACRVDGGDALDNWRKHSAELHRHVDILNNYNFKELRYHNTAGTDVTVELPEGHYWGGGEEEGAGQNAAGEDRGVSEETGTNQSESGSELPGSEKKPEGKLHFSANIPTEEVFTLPKREGINGRIVATKPLSHNGTLIDGFWFEVKEGKIVDLHADRGEEVLRDAIAVDEGASYFGEVALVPYDSPISNSGVLFLNTLFDENASCHFAFGEAYPLIIGAENMTDEELKERGANFSMTHVDFMVGSPDLEITGITHEGEEVAVFRNGNFAF